MILYKKILVFKEMRLLVILVVLFKFLFFFWIFKIGIGVLGESCLFFFYK